MLIDIIDNQLKELRELKTKDKFDNMIVIKENGNTFKFEFQDTTKFAKGFQTLSALMIERATEILHKEDITSGDINNISKAISNMNDTLGVFPKMPSIAQQINIDSNAKNAKTETKDINLHIEFLETKNKG